MAVAADGPKLRAGSCQQRPRLLAVQRRDDVEEAEHLVEVLRRVVPAVENERHLLRGDIEVLEAFEERLERRSERFRVREVPGIHPGEDRDRFGGGEPEANEVEVEPFLLAATPSKPAVAPMVAEEVGPVEEEMAWSEPLGEESPEDILLDGVDTGPR